MVLPATWDLPGTIRNSFSRRTGRQRLVRGDGHLLIALHQAPEVGEVDRAALYLWRQPDGQWQSHTEPMSSSPAVTAPDTNHVALRQVLERYDLREDRLEEQEKSAANAADHLLVLREVITVQHAIRNLHETLEQAVTGLDTSESDELLQLRDYAYEIRRSYDLLESFSRGELEIYQAKQAEEANRKANDLNLVVVFTLPLTALASVLGMEIDGGAIFEDPFFWLAIALGLVWGWGLWQWTRGERA